MHIRINAHHRHNGAGTHVFGEGQNKKTAEIDKEHSTSPVPFILVAKEFEFAEAKNRDYLSLSANVPAGIVSDIAPTILELLNIQQPKEMNGRSLLEVL